MRTKTKTSTKTKVAVAIGAVAIAAAAGAFGAMRPAGPGITITAVNSGEYQYDMDELDAEIFRFNITARAIDINVKDINFNILVDSDGSFSSIENDVTASDIINLCELYDLSTGSVVGGPMTVDSDNMLNFTDDFTLFKGSTSTMSVRCDFVGHSSPVSGNTYAVTARIIDRGDIVYQDNTTGSLIPIRKTQLGIFNRGLNSKAKQAWASVTDTGKLTLSLSSSTPSGTKIPGDSEVFRFNAAASSYSDLEVGTILFEMNGTDNDSTGWLDCSNFDASQLDVYNLSTTGTSSSIDLADWVWTLLASDGAVCSPGDDVKYLRLEFAPYQEIPAGMAYSYALYLDTSALSSGSGDTIRIDFPSELEIQRLTSSYNAVDFADESGNWHDGARVDSLPLAGGTLVY